MQHFSGAKLPQADFHPEPVSLVKGAIVCLGASFRNQVTLGVEGKFGKTDQKLEAAKCLDIHILSWIN
jgi:hypothetical protein